MRGACVRARVCVGVHPHPPPYQRDFEQRTKAIASATLVVGEGGRDLLVVGVPAHDLTTDVDEVAVGVEAARECVKS